MHNKRDTHPLLILLLNIVAYIVAYYVAILLHEYGHGTAAWLYGVKSSPFNITYGGWMLLHVDEGVNYAKLIANHRQTAAALIGIAGVAVTLIITIVSFILLSFKKIQRTRIAFIFVFWFLIVDMVAIVQYFALSVFATIGDMGRFVHGLNLSPWIIFIPGVIIVAMALWRIYRIELIKAYVFMPITSVWGRRILLLATLAVIFLTLYTHKYNPIADNRGVLIDQIMAILSIIMVPILMILCDPSRIWVKNRIKKMEADM